MFNNWNNHLKTTAQVKLETIVQNKALPDIWHETLKWLGFESLFSLEAWISTKSPRSKKTTNQQIDFSSMVFFQSKPRHSMRPSANRYQHHLGKTWQVATTRRSDSASGTRRPHPLRQLRRVPTQPVPPVEVVHPRCCSEISWSCGFSCEKRCV